MEFAILVIFTLEYSPQLPVRAYLTLLPLPYMHLLQAQVLGQSNAYVPVGPLEDSFHMLHTPPGEVLYPHLSKDG
jgi:hypothetical protein